MSKRAKGSGVRMIGGMACALAGMLGAPAAGQTTAPVIPLAAEEKITLVKPEVDRESGTVTLPAAFWNQQMRSVVEVALCGRPSDFLHETILSVTITEDALIRAMREAGFHDADEWVSSVRDFPRVRGDRVLMLVTFERDHVVQTYALDELLMFAGWNVSIGPYGWMFKGDPEHTRPTTAPTTDPISGEPLSDAGKILRDDPQVALQFAGLQHVSQSFIDNPLAYDDWAFPMMDYYRNTAVLPESVFDSNGTIPVTLRLKKVTEEEYLDSISRVWHDGAFRPYARAQMPIAKQIDADKKELWGLVQQLRKMPAEDATRSNTFAKVSVKAAEVEKGYAALDAAWSSWAADHAAFDPKSENLEMLKQEATLWKAHGELMKRRAADLATAEEAAYAQRQGAASGASPEVQGKLRGQEIAARSDALLAQISQPREKWMFEQQRLDPGDPRVDWIKGVALQVALLNAQQAAAEAGKAYGTALEAGRSGGDAAALEGTWARAQVQVTIAQLRTQLADVAFELSKREGIQDDPDVPGLKAEQARLEGRLADAEAATRPATQPSQGK